MKNSSPLCKSHFALPLIFCCAALTAGIPPSLAVEAPDPAAPARLLFTLDAAKCWSGAEAEQVRDVSSVHPIIPTWWAKDLDKSLGLAAEDVSRVMAFVAADGYGGAGVLTSKPYDLKKVLATYAPGAKEATVGDQKYYASPNGFAVAPLGDRALLISSATGMPHVLHAKIGNITATDLVRNTLAAKPSKTGLALRLRALKEGVDVPVAVFEGLTVVLKSSECTLLIEADDNSLKVVLRATYADEQQAKQGLDGMKEFVEILRQYMAMAQTEMPQFLAAQEAKFPGSKALGERMKLVIGQAEKALTAAKIELRGKVIEAQATIETKEPITTAVLLSSLMPREAKKPGARNPGE